MNSCVAIREVGVREGLLLIHVFDKREEIWRVVVNAIDQMRKSRGEE